MKAQLVYENLDFERGKDPKEAIGIGSEAMFKKYMEGWSDDVKGRSLLHHYSYWDKSPDIKFLKLIMDKKGEDITEKDIEKALYELCGKTYSGRDPEAILKSVKYLFDYLGKPEIALNLLKDAADETWNSNWDTHQARRDLFDFLFEESQKNPQVLKDRLPRIFKSMLYGGYEKSRLRSIKKIINYGSDLLNSDLGGDETVKHLLDNRFKSNQKLSLLKLLHKNGNNLKAQKYLKYALKENLPRVAEFFINDIGIKVTPGIIEWASQWPEVQKTLEKTAPEAGSFKGVEKKYYLESDVKRVNMGYGSMASDVTWELYDIKGKLIKRHNQNSWDDDKFRDWKAFIRNQGIDVKEVEKR